MTYQPIYSILASADMYRICGDEAKFFLDSYLEHEWIIHDNLVQFSCDANQDYLQLTNVQLLHAHDPILLDWEWDFGCLSYVTKRSAQIEKDQEFDFNLHVLNNYLESAFPIVTPPFASWAPRLQGNFVVKNVQIEGVSRQASAWVNKDIYKSYSSTTDHLSRDNILTFNMFGIRTESFNAHSLPKSGKPVHFSWFVNDSEYITCVTDKFIMEIFQTFKLTTDIICNILHYLPYNPKLVEIRTILHTSSSVSLGLIGAMEQPFDIVKSKTKQLELIQCLDPNIAGEAEGRWFTHV